MRRIEDPELFLALNKSVGKTADYIAESCRLYHFYFGNLSFSYTKSEIIKLLAKELL